MQTVARSNFITVKTEGGILPADLLQRIADGEVDGLNPTDYHLAASERPNEAINRSWNRLLGVWQAFQNKMEQMAPSETGTTMTREWLLTVLQELGYGRLPYQGKLMIGDSDYPISHLYDHTPIHLVTFQQKLDAPDRSQAVRRSPHSLLQECLNRSDTYLWGFVSNGLRLRVLRDNVSLTRVAYVEFDLEAMFGGELYADFALLWLLCHQSRVEVGGTAVKKQATDEEGEPLPTTRPPLPSDCWLERWSQQAADQGTRALDALRDGVQEAITALGRGFLAHPANRQLKEALKGGVLTTQDYYRQLLRLVYRLLFLFVAEDRDLLLLPGTPPAVRQQYDAYYSVARLRRLAENRRGGPHPDLYHTLTRLFGLLRTGYGPLGLPGLGSFLFSERTTPALDIAQITNQELLAAVRALAFTVEGKVRRPVDYKNLGPEELGSVYESLLELHPQMHVPSASFNLDVAAGSERKTTGSYYTPASLIQSLLDSALEPVVADRLQEAGQGLGRTSQEWQAAGEKALLAIKVVDPAAGSGHFLIAAARRLARHLARVRTGDDEPGPEAVRHALRDVVGHCIHGVDINEMAVELCKVALWMESVAPGRPLSFLDAQIRCGNSLMGATPALLARGIPDEAFTPITGDDKGYCAEWKKRNKVQRQGQLEMFRGDMQPWQRLGDFANAMRRLEGMADDTLAGVQAQETEYYRLVRSSEYEFGRLLADAWCAAFVWRKQPETQGGWPYPITEQVFRNLERSPHREPQWLKNEVRQLAEAYQFFHWHLEFPHVFRPKDDLDDPDDVTGWGGGFDVVLGNPPWEHTELKEKEWFAASAPEIANADTGAIRKRMIEALIRNNPELYSEFEAARREHDGVSHFARNSSGYPLCGRGRINTYAIFAELSRQVQSETGRVGIIVPSGIATDDTTKYYFQALIDNATLISLYSFENEELIFPAIHHATKFCLLTLTGSKRPTEKADFVFFARQVSSLKEPFRHFSLTASEIALLNPNTRTCPVFRSQRDAELTKAIYHNVPVLIQEGPPETNHWGVSFRQGLFNMTSDSKLFHTREQLEAEGWRLQGNHFIHNTEVYLPLYEGKMFHHFDHRFGSYEDQTEAQANQGKLPELNEAQHADPSLFPLPRYWVPAGEVHSRLQDYEPKWLIAFRDITGAVVLRTAIFSILPRVGVGHTAPLVLLDDYRAVSSLFFIANVNALVFDYATRQKVGGTHLTYSYLKQLPCLVPTIYEQPCQWISHPSLSTHHDFLLSRTLELIYTAYDLHPFAHDCTYHGPPFRWNEARRFLLRCELDAAYFHLYGITRDDVDYIMDTFPIVRRKDEAAHGEYRTKRVILEIYNEMAQAMQSSIPYQTRLDPPPAHPDAAHPWDTTYLGPELPRDQWWQKKDEGGQENTATAHHVGEPAPTFELKPPPAPSPKAKTRPTPAATIQPTLLPNFSPPKGERGQRLKAVMGLAHPKTPAELGALIGALADEDTNIRWLAGSSLARLGGLEVVHMLAAFLQSRPGKTAEQEAVRVLGLIADTDEDEGVQESARKTMQST